MKSLDFIKRANRRGYYTAVPMLKDNYNFIISINKFIDGSYIPVKYGTFINDELIYKGGNLQRAIAELERGVEKWHEADRK